MNIKLSDHFTYSKLIRFTIPSVIMMIFTSVYGVVDGLFVSNYAGKTAFAAVNLIIPFLMIFGAIGFMIGTGGTALVSKTLGEGNLKKANGIFSMLVYVSIISGFLFSMTGLFFLEPVARFMGAEGELLHGCLIYGRILLPVTVAFILQNVFQVFLAAAEKPVLGLVITVISGITNIILDWVFVGIFKMGIPGAAIATGISQIVGGFIPLIYFSFPNSSLLRLGKPDFDKKALFKTCTNGSSEMMTNLSMSLVSMLYNIQLMKMAGENGIAAYGVVMYVNFIFVSLFIGYSVGTAPVIGFHYGAGNTDELKSLKGKSFVIIGISSLFITLAAELLAHTVSKLFAGYDPVLFEMTKRAFMLNSISFLFTGLNIFASSFFTALNNGPVSAIISFARTLLFQVISVLSLPLILKLDGIWLSVVFAELLALGVSGYFIIKLQSKYKY